MLVTSHTLPKTIIYLKNNMTPTETGVRKFAHGKQNFTINNSRTFVYGAIVFERDCIPTSAAKFKSSSSSRQDPQFVIWILSSETHGQKSKRV